MQLLRRKFLIGFTLLLVMQGEFVLARMRVVVQSMTGHRPSDVEGVCCPVRISSDGVPVCVYDARFPDGTRVAALTAAELAAVEESVKGKRVVLVDDSIVRGNTMGRVVGLLRSAGASQVHVRISSPPFLHPCYYGTDIDSEENLIACRHSVSQIAQIIGADSLGYLPAEALGLIGGEGLCSACFDGRYPTKIPRGIKKNRYERRLSEKP